MSKQVVIVSSCDSFRDAWALFFYFFFKEWPDCPFPIYLITNHGSFNDPRVTTMKVGRDLEWASNLKKVLDEIDCDSILYFQEDYFLNRKVDNEKIRNAIEFLERCKASYLGLYPIPPPEEANYDGHPLIGQVDPASQMRASLQSAVWNRKGLMDLLVAGESGWDMEKHGTERSREELFLRYNDPETAPISYLFTAIKRGAWNSEALAMCQSEGLELPLNRRPLMPETKNRKFLRRIREKAETICQLIYPRTFSVDAISPKENGDD